MARSSRSSQGRSSQGRSSSGRRAARPWWLPLLLVAAGWLYNQYFAPAKKQAPQRTTERRQTASRGTQNGPPRPRTVPERIEGGQLLDDRVVSVSDGDTIKLERVGTVRLIGVDTPELHYRGRAQEGGAEAGEFARRSLLGQRVQVELCAKQPYDRYGRALALVYVTSPSGRRVLFNQELVRQGYARVYSLRPCTVDEDAWNALYEEARRARRGLFARLDEVPDAVAFRRRK
jgi:endonuclease YncB( thermonuclease family)